MRRFVPILAFLSAAVLSLGAIAQPSASMLTNYQISRADRPDVALSPSTVVDDLAGATVVYLGETHDSAEDHQAQLDIIRSLHSRNPQLAIGLEMFQRPFQEALDRYLKGDISEEELRQQSEFDRRWGFEWEFYAPILRFAKEQRLPLLALNTPSEVSRRVAQKGLEGLLGSDRQWVPPAEEIDLSNDRYRQLLRPIFEAFHEGRTSSSGFETFFLAQVLWDETMADSVVRFLREHSRHQVVVLTGQGHVLFGYGIPDRVVRRMQGNSRFSQRVVLLNPPKTVREMVSGSGAIGDYFWNNLGD